MYSIWSISPFLQLKPYNVAGTNSLELEYSSQINVISFVHIV